jgi:hypothetical protein
MNSSRLSIDNYGIAGFYSDGLFAGWAFLAYNFVHQIKPEECGETYEKRAYGCADSPIVH